MYVALLIRVRNFSAISSGIDGIYPLPSRDGRLSNTSAHTLDTGASQSTGNEMNDNTKGQL
ncbi:Uncharacterised protein [Raoultella terrigena]|uniref:Uncharacterized protein n=1 Tax=Raoultella terrigena TaxID=577 RepID=A0A4U9CZQ6_RAOTE|nr:Uncharacterised protein [Raoultella terrigena]